MCKAKKRGHRWLIGALFGAGCAFLITTTQAASSLATETERVLTQLGKNTAALEKCFALLKTTAHRIDYSVLGQAGQIASRFPSSLYSQLLHLKRELQAHRNQHSYFSLPTLQEIGQKLGAPPETNGTTLYNELIALQRYILNESVYGAHILYLLGRGHNRPATCPFLSSIPAQVTAIFSPIFTPWQEQFRYTEELNEPSNVFSLLYQIQSTLGSIPPRLDYSFLPELGSIDDPSNIHTLFGQAVRAQEIIWYITRTAVPLHYKALNDALADNDTSPTGALRATLAYLKRERTDPPLTLPQDALARVQAIFKEPLLEHIVENRSSWPTGHGLRNSWQRRLEQIRDHISVSPDISLRSELRPLFTAASDNAKRYRNGTLIARCHVLCEGIADAGYMIRPAEFEEWMQWIGNEDDLSLATGTGIIQAALAQATQHSINSLKALNELVGKNSDVFEKRAAQNTVLGILNRLQLLNLQDVIAQFSSTEAGSILASRSALLARTDLPPHLRDRLGELEEPLTNETFCGRWDTLTQSFEDLLAAHQFDWAERIVADGSRLLPRIRKTIAYAATAPNEDLWDIFGNAWWGDSGIYADINSLLRTVNGGGVLKAWHDTATAAFSLFDCNFYWEHFLAALPSLTPLCPDLQTVLYNPIQTQTHQILDLSTRMDYLNEIFASLSPFLTYAQGDALYKKMIGEDGLLAWLRTLNELYQKLLPLPPAPHTASLTQQHKEILLHIQELLGTPNDPPGQATICSSVQGLVQEGAMTLFGFLLNPFRASRYDLSIESVHSLHNDLRTLQNFLQANQRAEMNEALDRIGNNWDTHHAPTLFGRLASAEEVILRLWNGAYYIPVAPIITQAAKFYGIAHEIVNEEWTVHAVAKVGTPVSALEDYSLFSAINSIVAVGLTAPLGSNVKYISSMLPRLAEEFTLLQATPENRARWAAIVLGNPEAAAPTPGSFAYACSQTAAAFYPIAGFFRFRQTEQFWLLSREIAQGVSSLTNELYKRRPAWLTDPNEIDTLIAVRLGAQTDPIDRSPPSLFSQANSFAIELYHMYSRLGRWIDDADFRQSFAYLQSVKEQIMPGDCGLFFLTHSLGKIQTSTRRVARCIQAISTEPIIPPTGRPGAPTAEYDAFYAQKSALVSQIGGCIEQIRIHLTHCEQVLPYTLGTHKEELMRCADMTEHLKDAKADFAELAAITEKLTAHMGYATCAISTAPAPAEWSCAGLLSTLDALVEDIYTATQSLTAIRKQAPAYCDTWPDLPQAAANAQTAASQISSLLVPVQNIQRLIRSQAMSARPLHCALCSPEALANAFDRLVAALEECSLAGEFLARTLFTESEINPQVDIFRITEQACMPQPGQKLFDLFFTLQYDNNGIPLFAQTADGRLAPVFTENSANQRLQHMQEREIALLRAIGGVSTALPSESEAADHAQARSAKTGSAA